MKRRYFVAIAAAAVVAAILLFVPLIEVSLRCPAEPPGGSVPTEEYAASGIGGNWPVLLYIFYVLNGERIVIDGVTCGPWQGS
jgi:hypothetical protein